MWGKRKRAVVDADRLRRVVNLIPEYVDALIAERMGVRAMEEGLDGRELHGPAERRLIKIEGRIAELIGGESRGQGAGGRLTCAAERRFFLEGLSRGRNNEKA
jgi:hypothetical protein